MSCMYLWLTSVADCPLEQLYQFTLQVIIHESTTSLHPHQHTVFSDSVILWELIRLSWWLSGKDSACQCRRHGFNPWVGKISWGRNWPLTPEFLGGKSLGQRKLAGYSPWGHKESDTTEHLAHWHRK